MIGDSDDEKLFSTSGDVVGPQITITSPPEKGTLTDNGNGSYSYNPNNAFADLYQDEEERVTFDFQVSDASYKGNDVVSGSITIVINGEGYAPANFSANNIAVTVSESNDVLIGENDALITVNGSVAGPQYAIMTQPAKGTLTNHQNGTFTFSAHGAFDALNDGETEQVFFDFRITDQTYTGNDVISGRVTITVTGEGQAVDPSVIKTSVKAWDVIHRDGKLNQGELLSINFSLPFESGQILEFHNIPQALTLTEVYAQQGQQQDLDTPITTQLLQSKADNETGVIQLTVKDTETIENAITVQALFRVANDFTGALTSLSLSHSDSNENLLEEKEIDLPTSAQATTEFYLGSMPLVKDDDPANIVINIQPPLLGEADIALTEWLIVLSETSGADSYSCTDIEAGKEVQRIDDVPFTLSCGSDNKIRVKLNNINSDSREHMAIMLKLPQAQQSEQLNWIFNLEAFSNQNDVFRASGLRLLPHSIPVLANIEEHDDFYKNSEDETMQRYLLSVGFPKLLSSQYDAPLFRIRLDMTATSISNKNIFHCDTINFLNAPAAKGSDTTSLCTEKSLLVVISPNKIISSVPKNPGGEILTVKFSTMREGYELLSFEVPLLGSISNSDRTSTSHKVYDVSYVDDNDSLGLFTAILSLLALMLYRRRTASVIKP